MISANAVQAAPVGLAITITTTASAVAGTTLATTITAQATMHWINVKSATAIIAAALAAGSGIYFVQQREAKALRNETQSLVSNIATLSSERDAALTAAAAKTRELERLQQNQGDLLRLRGEVGSLRQQAAQLGQLREENRQLRALLDDKDQAIVGQEPDPDPEADPQPRRRWQS
jgi:hypothetical protein